MRKLSGRQFKIYGMWFTYKRDHPVTFVYNVREPFRFICSICSQDLTRFDHLHHADFTITCFKHKR